MVVLIVRQNDLPPEDERHMLVFGPFGPADALEAERQYRRRNRIPEGDPRFTFFVRQLFADVLPASL